jgi:hypothetical protein
MNAMLALRGSVRTATAVVVRNLVDEGRADEGERDGFANGDRDGARGGRHACGAPAPPPVAPTAPALPLPAKPVVDVHALEARFLADGFTMVLGSDDAGRITTVSMRKSVGDHSAAKDVTTVAHASQWLRTYGDAFGYGRLGAGTPETADAQPTVNQLVRVMLRYPGAEGCPDLVVAATYTNGEALRLPAFVELFCPTAPGGPDVLCTDGRRFAPPARCKRTSR